MVQIHEVNWYKSKCFQELFWFERNNHTSNFKEICLQNIIIIELWYRVFVNYLSLRELYIPSSVAKIKNKTFEGCHSLDHGTIPSSV